MINNSTTINYNNTSVNISPSSLTANSSWPQDVNLTDVGLPSSTLSPPHSAYNYSSSRRCQQHTACGDGLILPPWKPPPADDDALTKTYRAIIYIASLAYLLFGVSIITDRIVSAMEVIASQKKTVTIRLKTGATKVIKVPFWHPVVVALTVFAIGTSSPEIFLPVLEIFKADFQGDELGPSLIVGSGAYHLFVITGVCLLSVQESTAKPIQDRYVFFTTTAFAILAYLWVYLLLGEISEGIVELWEAILTLAFFPGCVITTWMVSRRFPHRAISHIARWLRNAVAPSGRVSRADSTMSSGSNSTDITESVADDAKRRKLAALLQQLREDHPEMSQLELEEMAEIQMLEDAPKNAAFYRLQATKAFSGGGNVISKEKIKEKLGEQTRKASGMTGTTSGIENSVQTVGFLSPQNTCKESCGTCVITVVRSGVGINETTVSIDYEATPGTAKANANFVPTSGKLVFVPGQQAAEIAVTILDDGIYEEVAKFFNVKLSKPDIKIAKLSSQPSRNQHERPSSYHPKAGRVELTTAETTVSILDDDHCGIFTFPTPELAIPDNIDIAKIKVTRGTGTKGKVAVPYRISSGTAKLNQDYVVSSPKGVLHFDDGQIEVFIEIKIIDKNRVGDVYTFYIELLQPKKESNDVKSTIGHPTLGANRLVQIGICEDEELKDALDRLLKMTDLAEYVSGLTWADQLREAVIVFHEIHQQNGESPKPPLKSKLKIYFIHFISLPWKLIVALLPPARLLHGWVAYLSLLVLMGFVAALIGDCASYLGCTIGLKDTVTAMTLIAFGMGLPDTFASRHAAMHEKTADAAIGHITGANAVSVFLGIGMAWTVGAIYQTSAGKKLEVRSENLGFSVMLYCTFATAGVLVLLLRRLPPIRGELGGPNGLKVLSATFFILLWLLFIGLSILESYCYIDGFNVR